ncbi:N-acetylmuramoyl-L-alanine amidase [Lentilactobacillus senioris]|uniref:N-acetylmuramoyl-L-alanine amidase n=1 Tax=Lentilactobacillus senioris TaxID=931534 RepID=UPI0020935A21|nr:N-acetylmuramoyl-L-alanine amidase [Lentilactobacillus senioris]
MRDTNVPSVLLETGYINSDSNFSEIKSPSYQNQVADSVTKGLTNYFAKQA